MKQALENGQQKVRKQVSTRKCTTKENKLDI